MMRVAIYARISDDRAGAGLGVARQEKECRALCDSRGWKVAEVYADNDVSASRYSRKRRAGYDAMLRAVEAGEVDAIVAWHTDRLHRRPAELERFITVIEAAGTQVHTVKAGELNLNTPTGRLVARQLGSIAAYESEHKADRIRSKARELAEAGKVGGGGTRPLGYEDDRVTIRESEAKEIRRAVKRVLTAGDSFFAVTRDWNARGFRTSAGRPWVVTSVKRVLLSGRIAGLRVHQGVVIGDAVWPGIITADEHHLLVARSTHRKNRKPHRYLLTGMIFTPDGAPIVAAGPSERGVRRYKGPGVMIPADPVEVEVSERLLARLDTRALAKALKRDRGGTESKRARDLANQVAAADRALERINDMYEEGIITKADAGRRRAAREAERDALRQRLSAADNGRALPASLPSAGAEIGTWWTGANLDDRRRLLARFIERVEVAPARAPGRHAEPAEERVEVRWRV
jgi:DNA invertase Pin-like site-specific DNA recombinase